jgi:hypothetical protein
MPQLDGRIPIHTVEREYAPRARVAGKRGLHKRAPRELRDDTRPEVITAAVSLRHTDDPSNGKSIPEKTGRPAADAAATMPTNNKELGDIEVLGIVGRWRTTRDQCETDDPNATTYEKGEPALGFRPIERKFLVAEAPVGSQLQDQSLTEVVGVQLQEIRQYRRIARRRDIKNNLMRFIHLNLSRYQ